MARPKKERKPQQFKVLLVLREEVVDSKSSTKGLNKKVLAVVRWFDTEPNLEYRHMFFDEETGEWVATKRYPIRLPEWEFIMSSPERIRQVEKALRS